MDLVHQWEHRKFLIVSIILIVAFSTLVITSWRSPVALDPFWHLQMAKDWFENGLSPWVDHYSFTYNGHKITNPPVVFQGLLYFATSKLGITGGFQVFRFGSFVLTMAAVLLLLRQIKASAVIYALVIPMIVLLLQMRAIVRPELLSYTFSIIALALYFRAGERISARGLLPMIALMWVWSMYHSSVVGYIIFFGFFLDCAVAQFHSREPTNIWIKWFAWGVLIVAVGFLNPSFSHPLVDAITFPSEWKILIREYLPTKLNSSSIAGFYALVLIAAAVPVMAYKQRRFGFIVVWAVLLYSAITMRRMVTPSGIVIVMMSAQLFVDAKIFSRDSFTDKVFIKRFVLTACLISIGLTLYSNIERARYFMRESEAFLGRYPTAIADYMAENNLSGRIFNNYGAGGYLIYRLSGQNQVYIDGRTQILYPLDHMKRYENLRNTQDPAFLQQELDKYSVDYILWKHTQTKHDVVMNIGDFGLDFLDARFVLYKRGDSNFPLLGMLMAKPQCWRPSMTEQLRSERRRMDEILPEYSGLFPFADLVVGYAEAEDGKAFIDASIDGEKWFDEMRRFAGFRFLEAGYYDLVVFLFGGVEVRKPKDYLAPAMAKIRIGDYEVASQIISEYSSVQWSRLGEEDIYIQYGLYKLIEQTRQLTSPERERAASLRGQLVEWGYSVDDDDFKLEPDSFCLQPADKSNNYVFSEHGSARR